MRKPLLLALLKAHKLSLEKEKTIDKKQEFLKSAPRIKRPKKDYVLFKGTNPNMKMKSNPNKSKSREKESESDLQTSDHSISEMEFSEEVNLASFLSLQKSSTPTLNQNFLRNRSDGFKFYFLELSRLATS
ncbi:hypothetical protein AVEN_230797-1 [Araneus ventricosus]|uniref:Uncharacterized protein n=1 Tax=Araneus ventricosus TaxID=182803 RepID=A0A4Y2A2C3_ARAVE|nr:hypothetical protein AVEN_230797-1 [Araneus ventricosus]